MTQEIILWVLGGGALTTVSSILTFKYNKKAAEATAMSKFQEVYRGLIDDLRSELKDSRTEMGTLKKEMLTLQGEMESTRTICNELKSYKCTDLQCLKRKS